jgi:hypothetical protein
MMKIVMVLATLANVVALRGMVPRVSRYVASLSCNKVFVSTMLADPIMYTSEEHIVIFYLP